MKGSIRPWLIAFFLVNLSNVTNFDNPLARLATLAAMSERGTFAITPYIEKHRWTNDWARTPDGTYYSNKAPAPMLLGLPLYWPLDRALNHGITDEEARDVHRYKRRYVTLYVLSFFLQLLPVAWLLAWWARALAREGASERGIQWAAAAALFGNTASLYMNTFSGHAFSAAWALATGAALWRRRWGWVGFCFGWLALSDYGSAFLVPGLVASVWLSEPRSWRPWARMAAGALLPAALWALYHGACFGSPLLIANRFQNPAFLDMAQEEHNLWGIFGALPRPEVLLELLFGPSRGILFTQPWLLIALGLWLAVGLRGLRSPRGPAASLRQRYGSLFPVLVFALAGLAGLLAMNAAFGGWHGGGAPGPRYLSTVFPLLALLIGPVWGSLPRAARGALAASLALSMVFFMAAYSTFITLPNEPLWSQLWDHLVVKADFTPPLRFAALSLILGWALVRSLGKDRLISSPPPR